MKRDGWSRSSRNAAEQRFKKGAGADVNARRIAFPRPGNIEPTDTGLPEPVLDVAGGIPIFGFGEIQKKHRPLQNLGFGRREARARIHFAEGEDQGRIGFAHVQPRAEGGIGLRRFAKRIAPVDGTVLRGAVGRSPAAAGKADRHGGIEGGTIDARLSATYDVQTGHWARGLLLGLTLRHAPLLKLSGPESGKPGPKGHRLSAITPKFGLDPHAGGVREQEAQAAFSRMSSSFNVAASRSILSTAATSRDRRSSAAS